MRNEQSQKRRMWFGSAIILALVVVSALVFMAPSIRRMLQPSIELVALMDDARAITKESPVWIAGHEVGVVLDVQVRGADVDSTERVAVRMQVPRSHAPQIRRDSEVRVTSRRLIGDPVIDILPGSPTAPLVRDGDSLRQRPTGTWSGLLQRAEALDESFDIFFDELEAFAPPARRRREDLKRIEQQLTASATGLRSLVAALETSPARPLAGSAWQPMLDRLRSHSRQLSEQLHRAAERARAAHHDARPSLDALSARADTISTILGDLQATVAETGGGFLVRAQQDSAITKAMHRARVQLDSLVAVTKRNPLRFWF